MIVGYCALNQKNEKDHEQDRLHDLGGRQPLDDGARPVASLLHARNV